TIDDFWAFVSMLLAGGGEILSPESVRLMTTDHLTAEQRAPYPMFLGEHGGWGYGMATPAAGSSSQPLPWGFGWDGGAGTTWRPHPDTGVTGILFTQRHVTGPTPNAVVRDFWAGVNAAT